ncbi:MAG TPA: dihydrofolate reductase [Candidatus Polarisedimenticolia bacterium]|nr:dihydrofolate reductase [Candidatus Polarisedimenticolia bacterium]
MIVSLIAAMASNRTIGRDGALPWRIPADLRRFRELTMGRSVLMGRRTFESIGRPLPGRHLIVVSRRPGYSIPAGGGDVEVAASIDEGIRLARGDELLVAGGGAIYEQTIGRADRVHLTLIEREYDGDAFFPAIDRSVWRLAGEERRAAEGDLPAFRWLTYERCP